MFNGIIFNQGLITKFEKRSKGINIFVKADLKLTRKDLGVSVACDGVCLTLINIKNKIMEFYLSDETIQRSKFKFLKINDKIKVQNQLFTIIGIVKSVPDVSGFVAFGDWALAGDQTLEILKLNGIGSFLNYEYKVKFNESDDQVILASQVF